MTAIDRVQRLEDERLRPVPPNPDHPEPVGVLFRSLLDLITAECARDGMLPRRYLRRDPEDTP